MSKLGKLRAIWRIGKVAVKALDEAGVEVHGVHLGAAEEKIEQIVKTGIAQGKDLTQPPITTKPPKVRTIRGSSGD